MRGSYEPFCLDGLCGRLLRGQAAQINLGSRLSLAGTQGKVGLFHEQGMGVLEGWSLPVGGAVSTHILKASINENVTYLEYLCTKVAAALGLSVAEVDLLDLGGPVLCSRRFDRTFTGGEVVRLHQEDLAQAFGVTPASKYSELPGGTARAFGEFARTRLVRPIEALEGFARISLFNYLVGNCDNHLKNVSLLYSPDWSSAGLAPAYDLVCTTWFPDLDRHMGMLLGGEGCIDDVGPRHLLKFAKELGMPPARLKAACSDLASRFDGSVDVAEASAPRSLDEVAWRAMELKEDCMSRLAVLKETARL